MMKKVVIKLHINNPKHKQKAMKAVSSLKGIESVSIDLKEKRLIVVGDVDPVNVVGKLRNSWHPEILTVGPAREWDRFGAGGLYKYGKNDMGGLGMDHIVKLPNDNFYYPYYNFQYYPNVYNTMDDTKGFTFM